MIEILAAGFYSSLQDAGRFGFRASGVPVSGWMDAYSAQLANALLNNDTNAVVLEMTYQGAVLKFNQACSIALTGALSPVSINGCAIKLNRCYEIHKNDVLKIGRFTQGVYCYLAISGGFNTPKVLNSGCYYANITAQVKLHKNDRLCFHNSDMCIINKTRITPDMTHLTSRQLITNPGPEFSQLDPQTQRALYHQTFVLSSHCNRMAYKIKAHNTLMAEEIITSAVQAGTVQLTPAGEMIILMRECQTTGGYARVLQLTPMAINLCAQKSIGNKIVFLPNLQM